MPLLGPKKPAPFNAAKQEENYPTTVILASSFANDPSHNY
jgi:hypothetical protein